MRLPILNTGYEGLSGTIREIDSRSRAREHAAVESAAKTLIDIATAVTLLILLSPLILTAALLIVVLDRQSPLYMDDRVGRGGRIFKCLKLRSMRNQPRLFEDYLAAHPDEAQRYRESRKVLHDPRTTRLGAIIRKYSLDETLQLFNVLARQMSIVGPRPIAAAELLRRELHELDLLEVRPGLTGLWQVRGRSKLSQAERSHFDSLYVQNWSLFLDLRLLALTPWAVITARGAR